jgi:hypothetical protein
VQLAIYAISCLRCSEATVGQLTGPVTVLAIGKTTLAPATIWTTFCPGSTGPVPTPEGVNVATRSELTPGHSICPVTSTGP